jgi:muramoyltetrapeptide carboxypeptidase
MRIGICAPAARLEREDAARVVALAAGAYPEAELVFAEQCFAAHGHFAGPDAMRADALVALANDPAIDAIWFARGGYGACRIAETAITSLNSAAQNKIYLGYSDMGNLLGALYRAGIGRPVHGPMPADIKRGGGEAAVLRSLHWLMSGDPSALAPELASDDSPKAAFNLMTLAMLAGTSLCPDLSGHVVMVEEVSEHLYAVDRAMFRVTSHLAQVGAAGLRLGRVSDVPENDRPFGMAAEEIAAYWCRRSDIPFLGSADIGHDVANKLVPFG